MNSIDEAKIGVLVYRAKLYTYTMVLDWRDLSRECFRVPHTNRDGDSGYGRHVDMNAVPDEASIYFDGIIRSKVAADGALLPGTAGEGDE